MISNKARVGRALYLLKMDLDTFVPREFLSHHRDEAATALNQILGQSRDPQKPFHNMKAQDLLSVVQASWWDVFDRSLDGIEPSLIREVAMAHETWANRLDFSPEHAFQALTSIQRLLVAMSSPSTLELDILKRESLESEAEFEEEAEPESHQEVSQVEADAPVADSEPVTEETVGSEVKSEVIEEPAQPGSEDEPYLLDLIHILVEAGALQPQDYYSRGSRVSSQPRFTDDSSINDLNPALVQALGGVGVHRLFAHQGEAVSQALAGANVALEAGWAADETLTWAIPAAESLLRDPGSRALVICNEERTASALSARLNQLLAATGLRVDNGLDYFGAVADTASDPQQPSVLVTTADHLNLWLAHQREDWQAFLKGIKVIVIDQAQQFTGYFGANVAILLRRLAHRLAILGSNPQTIVIAQGCGNTSGLAESLTGKRFQPVSCPEGFAHRRHYVFIEPREAGTLWQTELSDRLGRAALAAAQWGKRVMVCCPNENSARQGFNAALALGEAQGSGDAALSLLLEGGPEPAPTAEGDATIGGAVFTTVSLAMEHIPGNYDGVILAGHPGDLRTCRQLIDSGGRSIEDEAFALFFSDGEPESSFAAHNLDFLLNKPPDQVVSDADMTEIIHPHLPALAYEAQGRIFSFSRDILGNSVLQALRREAAELTSEEEPPQPEINLRPSAEAEWSLWRGEEQIGSMSPYRKFREIYSGSVIALEGSKYRIAGEEPGGEGGESPRVELEISEAMANLRTIPHFETAVVVEHESLCLSPAAGVSLHLGMVSLEENLVQVSVIDESELAAAEHASSAPDHRDIVTATFTPEQEQPWSQLAPAFWINVEGLMAERPEPSGGSAEAPSPAGLAALAQMLRVGAKFTFPTDKYNLVTYSDASSIYLAEVGPEAQGIAKRAFDLWREMLELGATLSRQCPCPAGCLYCLLPNFLYDGELDKPRGLALADRLVQITGGS